MTCLGCIRKRDCIAQISDLQSCLTGTSDCTLCCSEDYCNWPPVDRSVDFTTPFLDAEVPTCIDNQPPKFLNCNKNDMIVPLGFGSFSFPVEVPWPQAVDNSGLFEIKVIPKDLAAVHVFNSDTQVTFIARDANGLEADCSFSIIRRGKCNFLLSCILTVN